MIKDSIEEQISELPQVIDGDEGKDAKVACVNFGFNNGDLIKLLSKRGTLIANGRFEKVAKINE